VTKEGGLFDNLRQRVTAVGGEFAEHFVSQFIKTATGVEAQRTDKPAANCKI
jgi:hypothetical protein